MPDSLGPDVLTKQLLVDGRDPTADEAISVSADGILSIAPPDADGHTFVTAVADGTATISVQPGAADTDKSAGSDDVVVSVAAVIPVPVPSTPLVVSLG